jgi:hypothetical protein
MSDLSYDAQDESAIQASPKAKPPAAAMQDTLARMEITLAKLVRQDLKDRDLGMLMADCRTVMTEAVGILHTQLTDVLALLDRGLQAAPAAPAPPPIRWARSWQIWVSGCCAGAALCGAVWWWWPTPAARQAAFAGALDGVLVQHYSSFSKSAQDALAVVYGQWQLQTPAQRRGNK